MSGIDEQFGDFPACPFCGSEYYWVAYAEDTGSAVIFTHDNGLDTRNERKVSFSGSYSIDAMDNIDKIRCGACRMFTSGEIVKELIIVGKKFFYARGVQLREWH